jgi:hypothetical protein
LQIGRHYLLFKRFIAIYYYFFDDIRYLWGQHRKSMLTVQCALSAHLSGSILPCHAALISRTVLSRFYFLGTLYQKNGIKTMPLSFFLLTFYRTYSDDHFFVQLKLYVPPCLKLPVGSPLPALHERPPGESLNTWLGVSATGISGQKELTYLEMDVSGGLLAKKRQHVLQSCGGGGVGALHVSAVGVGGSTAVLEPRPFQTRKPLTRGPGGKHDAGPSPFKTATGSSPASTFFLIQLPLIAGHIFWAFL